MSESGHIYILINPSIDGLVKIGKTTRDPAARAKELSHATGVPTPFYVAFSIEVPDCHSAEDYVYAVLEYNGFKRSPNREFFEIPLRKTIEVLLRVEKELKAEVGNISGSQTQSESFEGREKHPGVAILEKAIDFYYGFNGEIEDKKEAVRLLNQAKALNFEPAYTSLAEHFVLRAEDLSIENDVKGMQTLFEEALEILKEGSKRGHGRCYAKMAEIYGVQDNDINASKCWKKYFQSPAFISGKAEKWESPPAALGNCEYGQERESLAREYLYKHFMQYLPHDPEILEILRPHRAEIIEEIIRFKTCFCPKTQPKSVETYQQFLAFVEVTL